MFLVVMIFIALLVFFFLFREFGKRGNREQILQTIEKQKNFLHIVSVDLTNLEKNISNNEKLAKVEQKSKLECEIDAVKNFFPNFLPELFLSKAEEFFDSVFNAFANSHHHILKEKLTGKLYQKFCDMMIMREKKNFKQEILIKHKKTAINSVQILDNNAKISVSFDVTQMSALIDPNGLSFDNPKRIYRDIIHFWVFDRQINDEDWILLQTSASEK